MIVIESGRRTSGHPGRLGEDLDEHGLNGPSCHLGKDAPFCSQGVILTTGCNLPRTSRSFGIWTAELHTAQSCFVCDGEVARDLNLVKSTDIGLGILDYDEI